MRITLSQREIEEAIEEDILANVVVPDDHRLDITLHATRGDEGYTAVIDILADGATAPDYSVNDGINVKSGSENLGVAQKVQAAIDASKGPRRRGRPLGSKSHATVEAEAAVAEADANPDATSTAVDGIVGSTDPIEPMETPELKPAPEAVAVETPVEPVTEDPAVNAAENLSPEALVDAAHEATALQEPVVETANQPAEVAPQPEPIATTVAAPEAPFDAANADISGGQTVVVDENPSAAVDTTNAVEANPAALTSDTANTNSLFGTPTTPVAEAAPVEEPAPAPTVAEHDVSTQANETLTDTLSDAGSEVQTEPAVEADPVATPATPATPAPVKSLFG